MNRPQTNFRDGRADFNPPPPALWPPFLAPGLAPFPASCAFCGGTGIRNGDIADGAPLCRCCNGTGLGDPLPIPPGAVELPDHPRGPVSPTTRAAAFRAGQRHVDAIRRGQAPIIGNPYAPSVPAEQMIAALRADLAAGANDDSDGKRVELERLTEDARIRAGLADGTYYEPEQPRSFTMPDYDDGGLGMSLSDAPRDTHSDPAPAAHYRPPQGVPDAYTSPGRPPWPYGKTDISEIRDATVVFSQSWPATFCPSQGTTDPGLRARVGPVVRVEPGGRAEWRHDVSPWTYDGGSASEHTEAAPVVSIDWRVVRSYAQWTLVVLAFCAAGAWAVASLVAGQ